MIYVILVLILAIVAAVALMLFSELTTLFREGGEMFSCCFFFVAIFFLAPFLKGQCFLCIFHVQCHRFVRLYSGPSVVCENVQSCLCFALFDTSDTYIKIYIIWSPTYRYELLCGICTVQVQPRKPVTGHANFTARHPKTWWARSYRSWLYLPCLDLNYELYWEQIIQIIQIICNNTDHLHLLDAMVEGDCVRGKNG